MALSKAPAVSHTRVDEGSAGQRIDNFLVRVCKGVPKSHIYRILRSGEVRVNSRRVDQTYRLQEGDEVRIPADPPGREGRLRSAGAGGQALSTSFSRTRRCWSSTSLPVWRCMAGAA
jgi:23S rRNA pseudouridine955/2504/2580 synthase